LQVFRRCQFYNISSDQHDIVQFHHTAINSVANRSANIVRHNDRLTPERIRSNVCIELAEAD